MQNLLFRRALATLLLVFLPLPVLALPRERDVWNRFESEHFVFFSNASERSTRRIVVNLERLRDVLVQLTPGMEAEVGSGPPLQIYVFEDNLALVPYKPLENGKPFKYDGFFLQSEDTVYMVMHAQMGIDVESLLYPQFLQYLMGTRYQRLPLWFGHGMAQFYSTFRTTERNAEIGRAVEYHIETLRETNMIPLSRLFAVTRDSEDFNQDYRQGIFYAQSWALVHYLLLGNPERRPQTFQFFESVTNGTPAPEAFRAAFQTTEGQIEKELRDYVRRSLFNYAQIPVKPASEVKIRLENLPRHETLSRLGGLLLSQDDAVQLEEAGKHFRAALEARPGDGPALAGLCQIESEAGRGEAALACFEKAAQTAPDDPAVQAGYASLLREQRPQDVPATAKEREALTRVSAQKPDDSRVWMDLANTYIHENPMSPEGLRAFETVRRLRPGDSRAAANLVTAYVRSGQGERAAKMIETELEDGLRLLAWNAWVGEMGQQANRLLSEQKGEEALSMLEEIVRRGPASHTGKVAAQIAEIRPILEHNRFVQRYNEAVVLLQAQKVDEAHKILQELIATPQNAEDSAMARKLAGEVEEFLKARGKK